MTVGTHSRHHPRKRMIQYSAAFMFSRGRHGIPGRPVKRGDDGWAVDGA
jgi:hypothetical protein